LGARVVLASRDERRAREAMADVLADSRVRSAGGSCDFIALDLSDLRNVDGFVAEFRARHRRLDLLVNNAGLNSMDNPERRSANGLETCFAVNHQAYLRGSLCKQAYSWPSALNSTVLCAHTHAQQRVAARYGLRTPAHTRAACG
jgi:NAD(P)-dependent dehydrogenase (short-subunit alcohol dehydrogenase family)